MKNRAFVRYTKKGKIVPGSLILTSGSYPNGPGIWKEITTDLCCENNNNMNYKLYRAILFQDGTDAAPVPYVLENTLETTPVWVYKSIGAYTADLGLGILDATKVHSLCTLDQNGNAYFAWMGVENNPPNISSKIEIISYDIDNNNIEMGGYISVEIKIYS